MTGRDPTGVDAPPEGVDPDDADGAEPSRGAEGEADGPVVTAAHGAGTERTRELLEAVVTDRFGDASTADVGLAALDDGAVIPDRGGSGGARPEGATVVTTDAHVVDPIEFPGGDVGRLAVCGTVNDLAAMGATDPIALSSAVVVESGTLSYSLGLIDPDTVREEPDLPELSPPAEATLSGAQLDRGIAAADMVADHLRLRVPESRESLRIEAEGDTDDVTVELGPEDLIEFSPGEADSLYSLDYLKEMSRAIPSGAPVTVEMGTEFLVRLAYEAAEAGPRVSYRLAPRISTA